MTGRCQALDMDGKRCRRKTGLKLVDYHGDHELYYEEPEPDWVTVWLCEWHRKPERPKAVEGSKQR